MNEIVISNLFYKYFDKIFAFTLLSLGVFLKWDSGLFRGHFSVLSVVSSMSTAVLLFIILRSKPPEKIQIDLNAILACTLAVLPSLWTVQYIDKNEPVTVMAAVGSMIVYKVFLIACYLYLGENFGFLPAFRGVTSSGPYRLLRHPIYSTYIHMQIVLLVLLMSPLQLVVVLTMLLTSIVRIRQEEKILSVSPIYRAYKEKVKDILFRPVIALPTLIVVLVKLSIELS